VRYIGKDDRSRELIAGLAVGTETMAFQVAALQKTHVVNERLGGVPVVVIHPAGVGDDDGL